MIAKRRKSKVDSKKKVLPKGLTDRVFAKGMLTYEELVNLISDRVSPEIFELLSKEARSHDVYKKQNKVEYDLWITTYDSKDFRPRSELPLNRLTLRILEEYCPGKYTLEDINEIIGNIDGLHHDVSLDEFGVICQAQTIFSKEIKDYGEKSHLRIDRTELVFRMISLLMLRYTLRILTVEQLFFIVSSVLSNEFETPNGVVVFEDEEINMYRLIPLFVLFGDEGLYTINSYLNFIKSFAENTETPIEWIIDYTLNG